MATILEFRACVRGASMSGQARVNGIPAEIVLFPGVRYERMTETAAGKGGKSRPRRDKIEIDD